MNRLLKFILCNFRVNGTDPTFQGIFSKILRFFTLLAAAFILVFYLLEIFLNFEGVKTIGKLNMFPGVCMMVLKSITLQLKNKNLLNAIDRIEAFISYRTFGGDVEKKINSTYANLETFVKIYYGGSTLLVLIMSVSGFVSDDRLITFDAYELCNLKDDSCFYANLVWQNVFIIYFCYSNVVGFDCLFFYFVTEAYCAFEVTKHMLKNIRVEEIDRRQLGEFVRQHDEVISYVKQLDSIYSMLMLAQCWFSMGALILCLYMITSAGIPPPMMILIKFGTLYLFFATQFFVYCLGGTVIIEQSKSVAEEAFNVDWWSQTRPELRKSLVLIIARSQRAERVSVGRMMDLNFLCFVKVLNNSLSMYTLLLTMEKKANMLEH